MIVWVGFAVLFVVYETYAIATKEKKIPTLSRTIWRITSWQVKVDFWIEWWPGGTRIKFTFRPLRLAVGVIGIWATIHLALGPCALGIC